MLKQLAHKLGIDLRRWNPASDTSRWLRPHPAMVLAWLDYQLGGQVSYLQIGVHEGGGRDSLQHYLKNPGWRGLLVEPLPDMVAILTEKYADHPNVRIAPCVVSDTDGSVTFYRPYADYTARISAGAYSNPNANTEVASLDPAHIARHIGFDGDPLLVAEPLQVDSLRLPTLLARHDLPSIDLLQIDAEGYDLPILRQLDFSSCRPKVINFEHLNLHADYQDAIQLLTSNGYLWSHDDMDITAIDARFFLPLANTPGAATPPHLP